MLVGILIIGWALNMLLDYGFGFTKHYFFHWELFFLYMSGLIYYMGFKGYHQPIYIMRHAQLQAVDVAPTANTTIAATDMQIRADLKELIEKAMHEDKLYLDPELNLESFARHLHISPSLLSTTINTLFQNNFRNFINEYRTEEVKRRLKDPTLWHLSILGIALECGFNSEATFYRIFKKYTGLSPKEYIEKKK
jgi:AraC-like DNA-binding protein